MAWRLAAYGLAPSRAYFFGENINMHVFTFYVVPPHWHDKGSWNPPAWKTKTYLFDTVNIMGADVSISNRDIYYVEPD